MTEIECLLRKNSCQCLIVAKSNMKLKLKKIGPVVLSITIFILLVLLFMNYVSIPAQIKALQSRDKQNESISSSSKSNNESFAISPNSSISQSVSDVVTSNSNLSKSTIESSSSKSPKSPSSSGFSSFSRGDFDSQQGAYTN